MSRLKYFNEQTGNWEYISANGIPGANGKTAYEYAQDAGYTGSESDFAAKLAEEHTLACFTSQTTPAQVVAAINAGKNVILIHTDDTFGMLVFTGFLYVQSVNAGVASGIWDFDGTPMRFSLLGDIKTGKWSFTYDTLADIEDIPEIPNALPNPNALKFTGAVSATYDGSEAKTVNIPTALKNPKPIRFYGAISQSYDGSSAIDVPIVELDDTLTDGDKAAPAISAAMAMHAGLIADKDALNFTILELIAKGLSNQLQGIEPADGMYIHVSDIAPTLENLENGLSLIGTQSLTVNYAMSGINIIPIEIAPKALTEAALFDYFVSAQTIGEQQIVTINFESIPVVIIADSDNSMSAFPKKGVYFIANEEMSVLALKVNNFSFASSGESYDDTEIKELIQNNTANIQTIINDYLKSSDKYDDTEVRGLIDVKMADTLLSANEYTDTATSGLAEGFENIIYQMYGNDFAADEETGTVPTIREIANNEANTALTSAKSYTDTKISTHNTSTSAHNDIRDLISGLTTRLNTLANSDDTTLDQLSEIVTYIKNNKSLIDSITTNKVNVTDIVNNLTTNVTNKPLSAAQGVAIKALIDALQSELDEKANANHNHKTLTFTGAVTKTYDGSSEQTINIIGKAGTGVKAEMFNDASEASGAYSHAEGDITTASGYASHAEGKSTEASGTASHAEGEQTEASGISSHAEGQNTEAYGNYSHAEGRGTNYSITITGDANTTIYTCISNRSGSSLKAGCILKYNNVYAKITNVDGSNITVDKTLSSIALSEEEVALVTGIAHGDYSHTEGYDTTAFGKNSHAEGQNTIAFGKNSHAEGYDTTASGYASHAEGYDTTASGTSSHAEGWLTTASGEQSHAEGLFTTASNTSSHAEGQGTTASGEHSHAEGSYTTASGTSSHAEGWLTTASGEQSHAEGKETAASGNYSHVQGKYNKKDTDNRYAHIVGNGENNQSRSNAHTIDWDGNAWYQGDVYVGSTSGTNKDEGSKKLATEEYVNTIEAKIPTTPEAIGADPAGSALESLVEAKSYADTAVAALVNSAPETLDTLGELATAFEENADMVATLDAAVTNKAEKSDLDNLAELVDLNATSIESLQAQVLPTSLILADAITGKSYTIQIQNGQLVSFETPV